MPNKSTQGSNPKTADVSTAARDITERAGNAASSVADAAGDAAAALDEKRSTAADGLDTAASALYDRADDLPGGETVRKVARATADRLSTGADYVRSHDAKRMMADGESFVKSNPGRRSRLPRRSDSSSVEPCLATSRDRASEEVLRG